MKLLTLLKDLPSHTLTGSPQVKISHLECDSRRILPGSCYIALKGTRTDGHEFIPEAIRRGACAVVAEMPCTQEAREAGVSWVEVNDSRLAVSLMGAAWNGRPSRHMAMIGVTGTNGKTTTAYIAHSLLKQSWLRAGLIGTIAYDNGEEITPSTHTTPGPLELEHLLKEMYENGCRGVSMEVSSHALDQERVAGINFNVGIFTNLTQDHLDYHHTFDDYFEAKALLFSKDYPARRVISIDGSWGRELLRRCTAAGDEVITTGFDVSAQIHPVEVTYEAARTKAVLEVRGTRIAVEYPLVGRFNVENVMTAFGCALALGIPTQIIAEALATMPAVPGRLERVRPAVDAPVSVYVDYAHTPDALTKAIASIKELSGGRTIVVFGCGGNRDATKRPIMGAAALAADYAVVTSDNPRHEEPDAIIADIVAGMEDTERFTVEPDRRSAIAAAIALARPGDAILVAGKGHEDYQLVGDEVLSFDDRVVAAEELERAFGGACSD